MKALPRFVTPLLEKLPAPALEWVFRQARRLPTVGGAIQREYDALLDDATRSLRPYQSDTPALRELPPLGRPRAEILSLMQDLAERERDQWQSGRVSGAVYHGHAEHIEFLNQVCALYSQTNPLHADVWPSVSKFEAEIVAMTKHMLGASPGAAASSHDISGVVTSGGSESLMLAVRTYRDHARQVRGIRRPNMVLPASAHVAFDKAAQSFGVEKRSIPVLEDARADVAAMSRAIDRNTILLVGSTPSFPHGVIDPIEALARLAQDSNVPLHVDACLGGFVLPWAKELGYPVAPFDFRLSGVSSISADTHKYGYAAKGTSVLLYRDPEVRKCQYFVATDWPGGLYFSPTFAGSRPGALIAAAWASMVSFGQEGYREAARRILETGARVRRGIRDIKGLELIGDPLWVVAFRSPEMDIYRVLDVMHERGWSLNGLHRPAAVHFCVTLRHTEAGVAERFVSDLEQSVRQVRDEPAKPGGMAPVYGLAGTLPVRGAVAELLRQYVERLYRP